MKSNQHHLFQEDKQVRYGHNLTPNKTGFLNIAIFVTSESKVLVTKIAENIETKTPIASVTAKPLIKPVPKIKSTKQAINEFTLLSNILLKALSKPASMAWKKLFPALSSSFVRSKINMFASTAIPMLRINPATPARVNVTVFSKIEIVMSVYKISAMLATTPGNL